MADNKLPAVVQTKRKTRGEKLAAVAAAAALQDAKKVASASRAPSLPRRELPAAPYPGTDLGDFQKSPKTSAASSSSIPARSSCLCSQQQQQQHLYA